MSRRHRHFGPAPVPPTPRVRRGGSRALLVVDNRPLHATAWAELRTAQKKLEKATRDLHRHEQVDEPGFRSWLGATFPELVTAVRELSHQITAKSRIIDAVESESWISGRSPRAIWRQWQRDAATPPSPEDDPPPDRPTHEEREPDAAARDPWDDDGIPWDDGPDRRAFEAMFEDFCEMQGLNPDDPATQAMRDAAARNAGFNVPHGRTTPAANDARDIYRRLVQHLHPDRGGAWTPERARLWHEVQAAWEQRDADLLARLEAEWDIAADTLNPTSAISRLRAALAELLAARRDADRKIRLYRKTPEWRFSLSPPDAHRRQDLRRTLERQRDFLRDDLARLEKVIAGWERSVKKRRARSRVRAEVGQPAWAFDSD